MDSGNFISFWGVFSNFVYPPEELVNFGSQVKEEVVENFKNPTIFWRAVGTYFSKIWRFKKTNPQNLMTLAWGIFFYSPKILCMKSGTEIFCQKGKNKTRVQIGFCTPLL